MGLQERTCTMLLLSFLLFYATKWVELITLFHDFYHVVPIKLMTMHYSILYVLHKDTCYVLGILYSSLSFYCQRGDTKSTRQTRRKKNYEIFYDSLTCKFSPGDNRLVLGDHTPRCQHQAFLLLTGGSGVITLCIL